MKILMKKKFYKYFQITITFISIIYIKLILEKEE